MPSSLNIPPSTSVLVLPGYGGSGPAHWQTLWEQAHPNFQRVEERDWDNPDRREWVESLEAAVRRSGTETVLVAHSLACLQVAYWVAFARGAASPSLGKIRAAFLVAPPDPDGPIFPHEINGFEKVPSDPFPFPTLVVGSTNDPYATSVFTENCAKAWGARFVSAGALGHINAGSGLGEWAEGLKLLESLLTP